jgi:type VI protein secretion system component Hcp
MKITQIIAKLLLAVTLTTGSAVSLAQVTGPITMVSDTLNLDISSWSWGASTTITIATDTISRPDFASISLKRASDSQSLKLIEYLTLGTNLGEVTLERQGGKGQRLAMILSDTRVSAYSFSGASNRTKPQKELFVLEYNKITFDIDGIKYCYDNKLNKQC